MARLMSVAFTEQAVRDRTKTVTRRKGWTFLRPDDRLTLCRKVMGRKTGEPLVRIAEVEVVDVRREPLGMVLPSWGRWQYGAEEMAKEGFPGLDPAEFVRRYFTEAQGMTEDDSVTRIEWRYLPDQSDRSSSMRDEEFCFCHKVLKGGSPIAHPKSVCAPKEPSPELAELEDEVNRLGQVYLTGGSDD
jgi:hypothetical protein